MKTMLTIFEYKRKLYSFSSLDNVPLKIETVLKYIDDGKVPSYGDADGKPVNLSGKWTNEPSLG